MRANKLETALSRDRLAACLAPPDMFFSCEAEKTENIKHEAKADMKI